MRILLALSILLLSFSGFSQNRKQILKPYLEAGVGLATGITRNVYTKFIDPRIGISYRLSDRVGLNANLGYVYFFRRANKKGISFLPLAGGVNYLMASNIFLEIQIGGALILDGSDELYFLAEPGGGWRFNDHHEVKISYYGFIANSVAIGGINFAYRFHF